MDTPCLYCGKMLTTRGVAEHERHACRKNPNRRKRSFGKKKCAVCGKAYHAAGLRAHMATQHPLEFAKEKARRKPRSRSAQRREMAARAEASRVGAVDVSNKCRRAYGVRGWRPAQAFPAPAHHVVTEGRDKARTRGATRLKQARAFEQADGRSHQWQCHQACVGGDAAENVKSCRQVARKCIGTGDALAQPMHQAGEKT